MRTTLVSAAVLGVVHVAVTPSAMAAGGPLAAGGSALIAATTAVPGGEGGEGGRGSTLARAGVAPFLDPPDAVRPSPLVAVGEGGEGGRGRRHWRRRGYGYYEPYRYGWGPPPPPRYYYPPPYWAPPPPPPPAYVPAPRPPSAGIWIDPGF